MVGDDGVPGHSEGRSGNGLVRTMKLFSHAQARMVEVTQRRLPITNSGLEAENVHRFCVLETSDEARDSRAVIEEG